MRNVAFTLLAALFLSCQAQEPGLDKDQAREEILKVLFAGQKGWNQGDVPQYMQCYWQSDSVRFASGGAISYGWQNVLERYEQRYPDKATMGHLTFSDNDVRILSVDAAIVFGKYQLQREKDAPWGLYTLLFRKLPEGWRIVHDHTSAGGQE